MRCWSKSKRKNWPKVRNGKMSSTNMILNDIKSKHLDQLEDELLLKRKEFEANMEKRNAELDTYKKSLNERDEELAKREEKMDELEAEVEAFPSESRGNKGRSREESRR